VAATLGAIREEKLFRSHKYCIILYCLLIVSTQKSKVFNASMIKDHDSLVKGLMILIERYSSKFNVY